MKPPLKVAILKGLQNAMDTTWQKFFNKVAVLDENNAFTGDNTHSGTETFSGTIPITGKITGMPYALVSNDTSQSIPNATITKKTFNTVDYDDNSLWSAANNYFVIPAAALVEVLANNSWASNGVGIRQLRAVLSGSLTVGLGFSHQGASTNDTQNVAGLIKVAANDTIEVNVYQTSGGALNTNGVPTIEWFSVRVVRWL